MDSRVSGLQSPDPERSAEKRPAEYPLAVRFPAAAGCVGIPGTSCHAMVTLWDGASCGQGGARAAVWMEAGDSNGARNSSLPGVCSSSIVPACTVPSSPPRAADCGHPAPVSPQPPAAWSAVSAAAASAASPPAVELILIPAGSQAGGLWGAGSLSHRPSSRPGRPPVRECVGHRSSAPHLSASV